MAPLWIHALYWLIAGLAVLALVGWFLDGSDTRRPEVHHPKPIEPSDQKTSPNYIVSPPNQTRAS